MRETEGSSTLIRSLKELYGLSGVKKSFEDEGCTFDDVMMAKVFTDTWDLDLAIKIGGCGAKSDIVNSKNLKADILVCPMIETEFSIKKFHQTASNIWGGKMHFVCESKTCYKSKSSIFKLATSLGLTGVVVGRSDLANSFDLGKEEVDSEFISRKVESILREAKVNDLHTTLGGNINLRSAETIEYFYRKKLLDGFETRNLMVDLRKVKGKNVKDIIKNCITLEISMLKDAEKLYEGKYKKRIEQLEARMSN